MSLSDRLRTETRKLHGQAERSGAMRQLLRGEMDRAQYARLLRNLHALYAVLEPALTAHAAHALIQPVFEPALFRRTAIEADLDLLCGTQWMTKIPLTQAVREGVLRLECADPAQLLAHAYVRYLGDLSGGQILMGIVQGALALEGRDGTHFYRFDPADAKLLSQGFRRGLDTIVADEETTQRIVSEAQWAFCLHVRAFDALAGGAA